MAFNGQFPIIGTNHQGNNAGDKGCLAPLLNEVEATPEGQSEQCLSDSGYQKKECLQALEEKGINGYF